ncbi:MAG: energy transducer TonB [Bacteroidetes bacterium]|nr:energy transducer TonB [Bacteroidota bacterium]
MKRPESESIWDARPIRVQACLIASLLFVIAMVRFWPAPSGAPQASRFSDRAQEVITIEQIPQTRQQKSRPAPPIPLPPVEVPNDVILEDDVLELDQSLAITEDDGTDEDTANSSDAASLPQARTSARAVRIVAPTRSREAEKRKIKAEIKVEILVGTKGEVLEVKVAERYLLTGDEPYTRESVDEIGYGLEESAIAAARETVFRPARNAGKAVESYTSLVFSFGI